MDAQPLVAGTARPFPDGAPERPSTTELFGVSLARVTYDDVVSLVNAALSTQRRPALTIDAINTMALSYSCRDHRMRDALRAYDLVVPDGMPVVWCMNAKGARLPDRVYGPYLADRVLAGLQRPARIAIVGGYAAVHEWLRKTGRSRYPNAEFVYLDDAPGIGVTEADITAGLDKIERAGADLVFVCLGVPRQYYWTALARTRLSVAACISIGGAFDLVSGARRYAPPWMQRAGLTWLHRLGQEPRRLGPRYVKYNSAFLWLLLTHELLGRGYPRGGGAP